MVCGERIARLAIVGIGLRYPDASSPDELWENVLAGRSTVAALPDADLDPVAYALADARFPEGLPKRSTRVVLSVAAAAKALSDGELDVALAGEGAGVVVLMRERDAVAQGRRIYASITSIAEDARAAAGVAELIKAVLSVYHQVIPPGVGPGERAALWPGDAPIRAEVPAAGVVIEQAPGRQRRTGLSKRTSALVNGRQDAELLLLEAPDARRLRELVAGLAGQVATLATGQLADLAGALVRRSTGGRLRAALVVTSPEDARGKLAGLLAAVDSGRAAVFDPRAGVFLASRAKPPKIGYLFPGQGCGYGEVGALRHRFVAADAVLRALPVPPAGAPGALQPRIVASSLATLRVLHALGIDADIAVGHSLGELTALAWGGAMGGAQLLRLATARGEIMARTARTGGGMAILVTGPSRTRQLIDGDGVVIAGYLGPRQTVISGAESDVDRVCVRAEAAGVPASRLEVPHAFHSPLVRAVVDVLAERLAEVPFAPLHRPVVSSVTGEPLGRHTDLRALLREQVLRPVRFHQAASRAVAGVDLAIEVGPGSVLTSLLDQIAPGTPALSVNTDDRSLAPLLRAAGAAHALGVPVDTSVLFHGRLIRPLPERFTVEPAAVEKAA